MPETFSPIQWINDQAPALNALNLNRVEQGIESIDDRTTALEIGVTVPVLVPYATSITINATQGALFRCVAVGDLTIDDIVGGVEGQEIRVQVLASGGSRTLSFTATAAVAVIPSGQIWRGTFAFWRDLDTWFQTD